MKEIQFQMTVDLIRKLLEGLKIEWVIDDLRITIHPPQKGIFFTHEEVKRIERMCNSGSASAYEFNEMMKSKWHD